MTFEKPPKVVEGTVIRTARGTLLGLGACGGILAFASGFILWDTWSHRDGEHILPFQLAKDSLHTSFVVALCAIGGAAWLIITAFKFLFPHQLILGEEILQVIRTGPFGRSVETQVPYANIAAVVCKQESDGLRQVEVGIDVHRVGARGTYSCRRDFGKKCKNGRDLYLPRFLTAGPEEIARLIEERCK